MSRVFKGNMPTWTETVKLTDKKKSRSDERKRFVRNCVCDNNEIAIHCWEADHKFSWDQKKDVDRESGLIPRKIKETIPSLKNPNHINKISYMLPEIWLSNLW